jgi:ketosteroid isomerase-like protein
MDLNAAPSAITEFLTGFIEDFNNLDWPSFRARFCDDATVFFPQQYRVGRATGRLETDAAWNAVFGSLRAASGKTAPPFMHLQPQEIVVQELSGAAIATFTLQSGASGTVGRRSLVLTETVDGWRIAHLHGSTASILADR